jgi:DNA invertase Pin-like site-specific DNA recombinase
VDSNPQLEAARSVERHGCPTCGAPIGRPCRTRAGDTAFRYHTARFVMVPALGSVAEVVVPDDRRPGHPWQAGTGPDGATHQQESDELRVGYAYCSYASAEDLASQLAQLEAARCHSIFHERVSTSVGRRPELEQALRVVREAKQGDPARSAALVATDLGRVARSSDELMSLSAALQAEGIQLELLSGTLTGTFDPRGDGSLLFTILEAVAQLDRDHLRDKKIEGQQTAAAKGKNSGRPRALDVEMVARARQLRDEGVAVPEIAGQLLITTGKNAGRHPSVASVYRALAEDAGSELMSPVTG